MVFSIAGYYFWACECLALTFMVLYTPVLLYGNKKRTEEEEELLKKSESSLLKLS